MRNKIWMRLASLACAGIMGVTMTGCGQKAPEAAGQKVEISMLDFFIPGEGVTKAMKPLLDKYLAEHPNVTIDEESVSNSDLATKVQTLAAGEELPDIFMIKGQMAETFVENGKVYSLSEALNSDSAWKDNFKEGVFSNFIIGENIYAVPFQVTNTCVFYNTDLFKQAGIKEFPGTWSELLDIIPKLKEIGV
ncbi:ABC transporter substrate-binding protein, partial [Lacrimispora sp.]